MRSLYRTIRRDDLKDALALTIAVGVVGASFGALSSAAGVPWQMTVGLSLLVFAGAAQFLVVAIIAAGGSVFAAVGAALLINLRHVPFGLAIAPILGELRGPARYLAAHIMVDEAVAFSLVRGGGERSRSAYWMCGVLLWSFWQIGTVAGLLAGAAVPDTDAVGIDAAFPAALLALLLPTLRKADVRRVGLGAGAIALATTPFLPAGLPVLLGLGGLAFAGKPREEKP